MWSRVEEKLGNFPSRKKVARLFLENGLRVAEHGRVFCGVVELQPVKIAKAIGVDRRVVSTTAEMLWEDSDLRDVFGNLMPVPDFEEVAKKTGMGVVKIYADPHATGVLAKVALEIASANVMIRQALADDPDMYPEPKLTIITNSRLSGDLIGRLRGVDGVEKIEVF